MSSNIDKLLSENKNEEALQECIDSNQYYLGLLLSKIKNNTSYYSKFQELIKKSKVNLVKVKLLCNWCSSQQLASLWNKMSKGNYTWNNIKIVWNETPDYYVVINKPPQNEIFDKKKTIVFHMEPHMDSKSNMWGEWSNPDEKEFFKVCKHKDEYNNNEWHLSLTYNQLKNNVFTKREEYNNVVSTVLSSKYFDPGHIKRIDFVKYLESKNLPVHVYGDNRFNYKDYKGSLPSHCKDDGIFPYKYTFNAENHSINNYYTEKIIDAILGESLIFYCGCPNMREFIDPNAYVQLELSNFEADYQLVKRAIDEDWHSQRLPYIREAKKKILEELQFFPRIERIINESKKD